MQAYRQSFDSADYTIRKYKINANETYIWNSEFTLFTD